MNNMNFDKISEIHVFDNKGKSLYNLYFPTGIVTVLKADGSILELHPAKPINARYTHIASKEKYDKLLASGMFFEFHPELSGNWDKDYVTIRNIQ